MLGVHCPPCTQTGLDKKPTSELVGYERILSKGAASLQLVVGGDRDYPSVGRTDGPSRHFEEQESEEGRVKRLRGAGLVGEGRN